MALAALQTFPQQLLIPAGNTQAVVDAIFQARIPDPVERQKAVDNFIQQTGLPPTLGAPFTYYTNQIYVVESGVGIVCRDRHAQFADLQRRLVQQHPRYGRWPSPARPHSS